MNKFQIQYPLNDNQKMYFVWKDEKGKLEQKEEMKKDIFGEGKHEIQVKFEKIKNKFQYQFQIWEKEKKINEEQLWRSFNLENSKQEIKQDTWNLVWVEYRIQIPNKDYSYEFDISIKNLRNQNEITAVLQKNFFNNLEASEQITLEERENGSRQIVLTQKQNKTQEVSTEMKLKTQQTTCMNSISIKFDVSKLKIIPKLPENDYEKAREENIKLKDLIAQLQTDHLKQTQNMQQQIQDQKQAINELQLNLENQRSELVKQLKIQQEQETQNQQIYQQQLNNQEIQYDKLQQKITKNKFKESIQQENQNLKNDIDLYLQRILELEKQMEKIQKEDEDYKKKIEEQLLIQQKQINDYQSNQMKLTFNKDNIASYSSNLSDLMQQKELIMKELPEDYQQELELVFQKIIDLNKNLESSDYEQVEEEYKKKIKTQSQQNKDLEETLKEYEIKVTKKSEIISDLQEELKAYQIKINEISKFINQDQIKIHLKQIEQQMSLIENYEKQIKSLKDNLEIEKQKYLELQQKFEENQQRHKDRVNSLTQSNFQIIKNNYQNRMSLSYKLNEAERNAKEIKERAMTYAKEANKKWMYLLELPSKILKYKLTKEQDEEQFIKKGKQYLEELLQDELIRYEQNQTDILQSLWNEILSLGINFNQSESSEIYSSEQSLQMSSQFQEGSAQISCQIQKDQNLVESQLF